MKYLRAAAVIAMLLMVTPSFIAHASATMQFASRTELHSVPSLTLTDEQFLKAIPHEARYRFCRSAGSLE